MDRLQLFAEKLMHKKKQNPCFGRSLEDFAGSELIEGVPTPVYRATEFLCSDTEFLKESGIFRIAAVQSEVKALKHCYDKGEDPDLSDLYATPHTVANMFKAYFRELPEPLLTYELYDCFIAANTICIPQPRLECIQKILGFLPPQNYTLLVYLCKFLRIVSSYSAYNKMTAANLATVFAPNLLRPELENAATTIEDTPHASSMMQTMITDFEFLFGAQASQEKFDFEYFAQGQKPPPSLPSTPITPSVPVSPPLSASSSADLRGADSSEAISRKPPPPQVPPKPPGSSKPYPPTKPARLDLPQEREEEAVQLRPARERPRPVSRPLTIVDAPPVRAPQQGEVAQLTTQFHRMSQAVTEDTFDAFTSGGFFGAPTSQPHSKPPARVVVPISRSNSSPQVTRPLPATPKASGGRSEPKKSSSQEHLEEAGSIVSERIRTFSISNGEGKPQNSPRPQAGANQGKTRGRPVGLVDKESSI